jgi:hypothetical protein
VEQRVLRSLARLIRWARGHYVGVRRSFWFAQAALTIIASIWVILTQILTPMVIATTIALYVMLDRVRVAIETRVRPKRRVPLRR